MPKLGRFKQAPISLKQPRHWQDSPHGQGIASEVELVGENKQLPVESIAGKRSWEQPDATMLAHANSTASARAGRVAGMRAACLNRCDHERAVACGFDRCVIARDVVWWEVVDGHLLPCRAVDQ
ncbi:MAG: hypothetical protein AAGD07_08810 [Planctomycetota bacterium]